jgi:cellulose synthase/poly-beta-1,6-N-acetylglucosamine synthase-like glycosyltransferase
MTIDNLPDVSIVIIGRNEAGNIRECIMSALTMDYPRELLEIIYVDTGSTDGSRDIAKTTGVKVVEVSSSAPSAALARNRGLAESGNQVIHFVDGDMTIDPDYLKKAVRRLASGDVVSVIGRVIEKHADTNWISRMLNADWKNKEEGYISAPGGGGTFMKAALEKIGGYNNGLTSAEETDVGIRLRDAGYRIYLISEVMAVHDYGVNSVGELLKRYYASGRGRFRILVCDNVPAEIRRWSWALPKQAVAVLSIMFLLMFSGHKFVVVFLVAAYPVLYLARVIISDWTLIVTRKNGLDAFLYSYIYYITKPLVLLGMIRESIVYIKQMTTPGSADSHKIA